MEKWQLLKGITENKLNYKKTCGSSIQKLQILCSLNVIM